MKKVKRVKKVDTPTPPKVETSSFYLNFNGRNDRMINSTNPINQTVAPTNNVIFTTNNFISNKCNTCCGNINHNDGSGIFSIVKCGTYRVTFNANVAPTVDGAITLNITNAGENISGGEMQTAGTAVGTFENVSAEVLVKVCPNQTAIITVKNNTPTNPITVSQPSLIIERVA